MCFSRPGLSQLPKRIDAYSARTGPVIPEPAGQRSEAPGIAERASLTSLRWFGNAAARHHRRGLPGPVEQRRQGSRDARRLDAPDGDIEG